MRGPKLTVGSIVVTTTLTDLQTGAGKGFTGGGTLLPMADVIRRSNSRLPTTLNARDQPPAEVSDQRVSGLTGAVQSMFSGWPAIKSR